jgi:hypothetical protein
MPVSGIERGCNHPFALSVSKGSGARCQVVTNRFGELNANGKLLFRSKRRLADVPERVEGFDEPTTLSTSKGAKGKLRSRSKNQLSNASAKP